MQHMSYLDTLEETLRLMFANVANGTESVDEAVAEIKEEILASWKRGREQSHPQKKTPQTGRPSYNRKHTRR